MVRIVVEEVLRSVRSIRILCTTYVGFPCKAVKLEENVAEGLPPPTLSLIHAGATHVMFTSPKHAFSAVLSYLSQLLDGCTHPLD